MLRHVYKRASCNGGQNAVRLRRHKLSILCNKDKVCASCLFHLCSCLRIQIHIFRKSFIVRRHDGVQAHRIVQSSLDMARAMRRSSVKIADLDRQGFCAAFKIRSHRRYKDPEHILICRFHTDHRVNSHHVGADIERCAGTEGRYISGVCLHRLHHRIHKFIFRKYRHLQSFCGIRHSRCV